MNVTDKDREEAKKICEFYGIYAEPNMLKRLAESVARFRVESAEQAIANLKVSEVADFCMDELDAVMTSVDKWLTKLSRFIKRIFGGKA